MKAYSDLTKRTEDCVDTMYLLVNLLHSMTFSETMTLQSLLAKKEAYSVLWCVTHYENFKNSDLNNIYDILKHDPYYTLKIMDESLNRPQNKTERN